MTAAGARRALDGVAGLDAVVMLGTGMPTLGPILGKPRTAGAPVLSWIEAPEWAARYRERMGTP